MIVVDEIYDAVRERFSQHGGYMLNKTETEALRKVILVDGNLNADIVGQSARRIAQMAGVTVPASTKVLIGEVTDISEAEPFAHEKLSPTLGMYRAKDFFDACDKAAALVTLGQYAFQQWSYGSGTLLH